MSIFDLFRLDGAVALITGGGGGLGSAIARAFADAGADVAVVGRTQKALDSVCEDVKARGRQAAAIMADVTDKQAPDRIFEEVIARLGKITILVNNVGGIGIDEKPLPAMEMTEESWATQIDINLNSVWRMTKAGVPRMNRGVILNMSSIKAFQPNDGSGAYAAAKAAMNNMTLALSRDLAPNIRVNGIAPGPVPTEIFKAKRNVTEADFPRIAREWSVPLGRLGVPNDVAAAALFLASEAGSWITGQTIIIAGGM